MSANEDGLTGTDWGIAAHNDSAQCGLLCFQSGRSFLEHSANIGVSAIHSSYHLEAMSTFAKSTKITLPTGSTSQV
jgi:hypothetical protein